MIVIEKCLTARAIILFGVYVTIFMFVRFTIQGYRISHEGNNEKIMIHRKEELMMI